MKIIIQNSFVVFMLNIVFAITERSNFNKLYGTLPIKKSKNILSRYLLSLITIGITAIILFIIIQYLFYFKLEYTKASIMAILPYIICFAICVPLVNYLMNNQVFYLHIISIVENFLQSTGATKQSC